MQSGTDDDQTTRQRAVDGLRSNILVLVLLCVCWGFGIAAFQLQDDFLQQAFAISALLLGLCFFMMYLVLSHDVRRAILHGRKSRRRRSRTRMNLRKRKSSDSLTSSTNPEPMDARQLPPSRNEQSMGSTSTALSQHNTHSVTTNCTDLANDPIHEEAYGPYRRGFQDMPTDPGNIGYDQRMIPWSNLGLARPGPERFGDRSPQKVKGGDQSLDVVRRGRRESSPLKRSGNIVLNHRIIRDSEESRSTEEDSQEKRRKKRHVSTVSGSSPSVDMTCMPFMMDWRDYRGSRVHPMPLDEIPYSMNYSQDMYQPQYIHPRMAGFFAQPHRALPGPAPSIGRGPISIPETRDLRRDLGGFERSDGYYGSEKRSLRDGFYEVQHQALDRSRAGFGGQSSRSSYHRRDGSRGNWASEVNESNPGPSGYSPRGDSIDSQHSNRSSEGDDYKDDATKERHSGRKGKGQRSSRSRSRSHGGKKHRQKSKTKET
ncbi:uncharacterized protein LOC110984923 isoform X2 [Acanthaster planci]|uniref:Uncharacterized protein LOC110984923 isoform X2 n=1 Tax=Acanthaster planci TaxID=133434 RepID=A0A8B7ZDI2_ACAPL|nr:uncharacterized protein LOC110984923 isoform X2 [Acanthaster planci]